MLIIKLNAIDSTNSYLRQICAEKQVKDYTVVVTKHQTGGRGQMGTVWDSEKDKNLMCSVFKRHIHLPVKQQFYISMVTSLALLKTLEAYNILRLNVKWPNDILADNKKICGILIENVIKRNDIEASVIGIGLNVNQTNFMNLPNASSLLEHTGIIFDLDELLHAVVKQLKFYFNLLAKGQFELLKNNYETYLFRKDKPSTFEMATGATFPGIIDGVDDTGKLIVRLEDNIKMTFDLKEIKLLY